MAKINCKRRTVWFYEEDRMRRLKIFTLRLIIKKNLCHQTYLVFSFIDYEQMFGLIDRGTLAKVPSLYGIPDK